MKKLGSLAVLITLTGLVGCGDASEITSPNPQFRPAAQYVGASATKTACHTVTFVTRLTNRNVFIPNSSTVKNIGSLRESSGIGKVNVTYTGETSLETSATHLEFSGVICEA